MKDWDMRAKTLKKILIHFFSFRYDGHPIEDAADQETKLPK